MRLLLISHPPLLSELGAAQVAMNLAEALRARGHDVQAWSPEPLPQRGQWRNARSHRQQTIERFAKAAGPFDLIDTPATTASARLARCAPLIVRSTQPELRYLAYAVRSGWRWHPSLRVFGDSLLACSTAVSITRSWRRARAIVCLGSHELIWMRRQFPCWSSKLKLYFNTVPPRDRTAFAEVRNRRPMPVPHGPRFLWIGRWTAHKGTRRLLQFLHQRIPRDHGEVFTIAGCGPLAEREVPREWLRSGKVELVPSFSRAELPSLLANHEAGLFTSEVEGWGLTLNEMLESGMPVFATGAGAVADLLPYFPFSLRPFPPPADLAAHPLEDLHENGYFERFSWTEIARSYEQQVLAEDRRKPTCGS